MKLLFFDLINSHNDNQVLRAGSLFTLTICLYQPSLHFIVSCPHIYPTPPLGQDMTQFLSGVGQVWMQSFPSPSFPSSKVEEPICPTIFIAGERIIGFIPFPRVLVLCEMISVSSRIWTRVAVSISYDDNHYTTGTSIVSCVHKELIYVSSAGQRTLVCPCVVVHERTFLTSLSLLVQQ